MQKLVGDGPFLCPVLKAYPACLLLECLHMKADISVFHVGECPAPTRRGQSLFPPAPRGHFQKHAGRLTRMPAGLESCPS